MAAIRMLEEGFASREDIDTGMQLGCCHPIGPLALCDLSFGLSAGATAGLLLLSRPISGAIVRGPKVLQKLLAPIATTLAAMLGCAPLVTLVSPTFPLLGIAANIVAAPVGEIAALPVCLAHAVLWWAPPVGAVFPPFSSPMIFMRRCWLPTG